MAIKKSRLLRGVVAVALACCVALAMSAIAFAEESDEELKDKGVEEINKAYDFTVDTSGDGVGASAGISSGGWASLGSELSYMKFPEDAVSDDGEEGVWCYCIDISTDTEDGHKYSMTTLEAAEYYEDETADKIRSILLSSYPNVNTDELEKAYELTGLTEEEAFMATQWILWYYSNPDGLVDAGGGKYYPADIYKPSDYPRDTVTMWHEDGQGNEVRSQSSNVVRLAKALDALSPAAPYKTAPAEITFEKKVYDDKVVFDYGKTTGLDTLENVKISVKDGKGRDLPFAVKGTEVVVKYEDMEMTDEGVELTVTMDAIQCLSKDVYFFAPEGGRDASQSRVAAYGGTAPVSNFAVFNLTRSEFEEAEKDPDEVPEEPTEEPDEPVMPSEPEDPKESTESDVSEDQEELMVSTEPKTGDGFRMLPMFLAVVALLTGLAVTFFRKKKV